MQKRLPPSVSNMNTKDESLHFRGTTFIDSTELSGLKPDNGGKSVRRLAPKARGQVQQELAVNPFSLWNSLSMHAAVFAYYSLHCVLYNCPCGLSPLRSDDYVMVSDVRSSVQSVLLIRIARTVTFAKYRVAGTVQFVV